MINNRRFRVNGPDVTHETIDGEAVIINLVSGNYYSLQQEGAHLWYLLQNHAPLTAVVDEMVRVYSGDRGEIERGVLQLVADLQQENLIVDAGDDEVLAAGRVDGSPWSGNGRRNFQAPMLQKFTDMQELLLLDPIHEVNESGWPHKKPGV